MTDIVERLRTFSATEMLSTLREEAAEEIERLREEAKASNDEAYRAWAIVQDKQAEIGDRKHGETSLRVEITNLLDSRDQAYAEIERLREKLAVALKEG